MKKKSILVLTLLTIFLVSCATKSYVRLEDERIHKEVLSSDSTLMMQIMDKSDHQDYMRDSLYNDLSNETEAIVIDLMGELYYKSSQIDSLQNALNAQAHFLDSITADVNKIQMLESKFKDADYSMYDLGKITENLDSLNANQKTLNREMGYLIRDLGLIERNIMDIMNYSMKSLRNRLQASTMMMNHALYNHSATAYKMIMIYLMSNASSDPNELLEYIDSVYALGPGLDTIEVSFDVPEDSISTK